jgi:hypothetical protein
MSNFPDCLSLPNTDTDNATTFQQYDPGPALVVKGVDLSLLACTDLFSSTLCTGIGKWH